MTLAKPAHLSLHGALTELSRHFPAEQTPIVTRQRITDRCVTPYTFGQTLLRDAYDLRITPNDSTVLITLRQLVTERNIPIHPDALLAIWKDEPNVPAALARSHHLTAETVHHINQTFASLDRSEERTFEQTGTISMTGLLSLPAAVALKGPDTIITSHTTDAPLTSRSRALLTATANERLLIVTDSPSVPDWHVEFQHAET